MNCRICLKNLYRPRPTKPGRRAKAHPRCLEVVEREILSKPAGRTRPKGTKATPPEPLPAFASASPCDFCARVHGNGQERAECARRAERARADVREVWR